ncbi:NHL domain-containing protein [Roseovarius sp. ZX-A-9]|uniref:NHL domain-containing protein n=1 Tax=Roseovarius sp. ZX-A-9 TaxID=3014783 RepID=UPI00232AC3E8|nr:hypothetical protein [Roseovarius sp. ZX-A-9]
MINYLLSPITNEIVWSGVTDPLLAAKDLEAGSFNWSSEANPLEITARVVVDDDIPGRVLQISPLSSGFDLQWGGPDHDGPFLLQVRDETGNLVHNGWVYQPSTRLLLDKGAYNIKIAPPGEAGFQTSIDVGVNGDPSIVNNIPLHVGPQDIADFIQVAVPIGQGTSDGTTAAFSFLGEADTYTVQIRNESGTVQTFETSDTTFTAELARGNYDWRVFSLPSWMGDPSDQDVPWHNLHHTAGDRPYDYILGMRPDLVDKVHELKLTFPSEGIRLEDGSFLIPNTHASTILRVFPNGTVEKVAGNYARGYDPADTSGDTPLALPTRLAQAQDGAVFFADTLNLALRRIDLDTGTVTTISGGPEKGSPGLNGGALTGTGYIDVIGFDSDGNLFLSSFSAGITAAGTPYMTGPSKIYRQASDGTWRDWTPTFSAAVEEAVADVTRVQELLWHGDLISAVVRNPSGERTYVLLTETGDFIGDIALGALPGGGLAYDPVTRSAFVGNHTQILQISIDTLEVQNLGGVLPFSLANVSGLSVSGSRLIITDSDRGIVFDYDLSGGELLNAFGDAETLRHRYTGIEAHGDLVYLVDNQEPRLIEYTADGEFAILAGTGIQGISGSARAGDSALTTTFHYPSALTVSDAGDVYIVESNHRVVKISEGRVDIVAGGGATGYYSGYSGDNGPAQNALFRSIRGLEIGPEGTLYIADSYNHAIRTVDTDGIVRAFAGNGTRGIASNVDAHSAALNMPTDIIVADDGRVIVSDSWNNRVVEIGTDGILRSIAGIGSQRSYQGLGAFSGDGSDARLAELNTPKGLALREDDQTLYIADSFNNRIRYIDSAGDIHTLIGAEGGFRAGERLSLPAGLTLKDDDLYIADAGNDLVLRLNNVDRTGDDRLNALDVARARDNLGHFNRPEHVGPDDADHYDLTGNLGSLEVIVSVKSGVAVFEIENQSSAAQQALGRGQSFIASASDLDWLAVSSGINAGYRIDLVSYRNDYIGNTPGNAFDLNGSDPLSPSGNWWETVSSTDPDVYRISNLDKTIIEISAGSMPISVGLLDAAGRVVDWRGVEAGATYSFDNTSATFFQIVSEQRANYSVGLHTDMVGNDYSNAADVGAAIAADGAYFVNEHVSATDGDFFDFREVEDEKVKILSADDDLHLVTTDAAGSYLSHAILNEGQDMILDSDHFDFLLITSQTHVSYALALVEEL